MRANTRTSSAWADITGIPSLPAVVRYYDDFNDTYTELRCVQASDAWAISYDGSSATLDFEKFNVELKPVLKSWCAYTLGTLSPRTVHYYYYALRKLEAEDIGVAVTTAPQQIRSLWKQLHARVVRYDSLQALQNLLSFCCRHGVAQWAPGYGDLVSQLQLPKRDKYASVRIGNVFLCTDEEAGVVHHLDHVSAQLQAGNTISDDDLDAVAALLCLYQFAFRPKQIAMFEMRNLRIWNDGLGSEPAVHLTFTMIKQRSAKRVFPMVRRVKRDWSPIFLEVRKRCRLRGLSGADHVFQRTPQEISRIADHVQRILNHRRTANEFRHTAAQRLVDAGATEEEVAAFMGHTDLNTGLPYFRSSPSQAERVNKALGLSELYRHVAKIAHDRFISVQELMHLKGDQQIAGVPHGIPISGVGGCSLGQPSCPFNPVMSCYGCPKFMPVAAPEIHKQVLNDLRGIFKLFYTSSLAERGSPAFQLARTIAEVQGILAELEEPDELPS